MHPAVRFVFVLHDHQPVGNFHDVVEAIRHVAILAGAADCRFE